MVGETSGVQYPWLKDLDRAMFLLGELGPIEAAKILNDPRDWAAFCDRHRLSLDPGDVEELKAVLRV